jgi:hypothetical protein
VERVREGGLFNTAPVRPQTEEVESWVSHNLPCGEFFGNACG